MEIRPFSTGPVAACFQGDTMRHAVEPASQRGPLANGTRSPSQD